MNWYKLAELTVTPDQFQAWSHEGKKYIAMHKSISPEIQLLFFTQKYEGKDNILWWLAHSNSISPEIHTLFFTQEYEGKSNLLWHLAQNTSISLQTQRLFFTQEYEGKSGVLFYLFRNRSFLKGVTLQEMREFTKIKEARLHAYRARLKTIKEKIKL